MADIRGYWEPVVDEIGVFDLEVTGTLPAQLTGRYFRNGPNPMPGQPKTHRFVGHGMLHGVRLRDGRAEWYRNRWTKTRLLEGAPRDFPNGARDRTVGGANTHIIRHGGRLLALQEGCMPYQVTDELDTIGPFNFDGKLTSAMTAHPKEDPESGELHTFGYSAMPPYLTYNVISPDGELTHSREVPVAGPTMMHDFGITKNYVIWLDMPMVFDKALAKADIPYRWDNDYGCRIGVMRKDGGDPTWYEIEECFAFHVGNAYEDVDGTIVVDSIRYTSESFQKAWVAFAESEHVRDPAVSMARGGQAHLHRWRIDPARGTVSSDRRDDRDVEFPSLNDRLIGRDYRYLYTIRKGGPDETSNLVVRYDTKTGESATHDVGENRRTSEVTFVQRDGTTGELDGWLIAISTRRDADVSDLIVLDAADLGAPPVASVHLPRRVPGGFHGSWLPDEY